MKISEEIKAKIVIEADTSGADEAAAALEKLQGMAGGEGGIGDALAQQFDKGNEAAGNFADALGGSEEALKANEEVATEATAAMEEHQQAVEGAGSAHEQFAGQVEETANQLQAIPSSINEVTKSTQAMSEQMAKSGDNISSLSDGMTNFVYANEGVASWWSDSMLAATEKTYSVLQATPPTNFVPETLWSVGEQAKVASDAFSGMTISAEDAGQAVYDFLGTQSNGDSGFVPETLWDANDAAKAVSESVTSANQSFAAIVPTAANADKAVSEFLGNTNDATQKTGGLFGSIFGEDGMLSKAGDTIDSVGESFNGFMMGFDSIMRPLMYIQMATQMGTAAADWIYNANLQQEGPKAGSPYSYTSQASLLGADIGLGGNQFAVGIGQGLLPAIEGWNAAFGGASDPWQSIGDAIGKTIGIGASGLQMMGGGLAMLLGGGGLFGNTPLFNAGQNWFTSGYEGDVNTVSQILGLPAPFTTSSIYSGQNQQLAYQQSHYGGTFGSTTFETSGPGDPMNAYEQAVAQNTWAYNHGQPVTNPPPFPTSDTQADYDYFNSMPYSPIGGNYNQYMPNQYGAGTYYGGTVSQQDVENQMGRGSIQNWGGAIASFLTGGGGLGFGANTSAVDAGNSIASNIDTGVGNFFGGIGNALHNLFFGGDTTGASGDFGGGCFIAGTRVLMADGSKKPIEQLQKGDRVLAYDGTIQKAATILACMTFPQKQTYELTFSDGTILTTTDSHPIYSPDTGWKSISPASTKLENPNLPVSTLQIDDTIATTHGTCTLISLEKKHITRVFNITVDQAHTYYANGVLVHNKVTLAGGAQSFGGQGGFQLPHIDLGAIGSNLASQFSGIQLPHIDLGGIASSLGGAFSGIQLPHLDLGGIASGLGGAFSGLQLPHLDLGGIASSLGGAFSGIQLPHLDLGGIGAALSGAFSGITLPHIPDLGGMINGALGGMFSGITLPSIPNIGGMINGALGGLFSGITLPSIPDLGGMISGAMGGIFSGITLPSIPNIGGMINGALGGVFSGITMPSIPDIGGMISGAMGGIFGSIEMPKIPDVSGMINGALGGMFSGITMPSIPNISGMINGALGGMFSGISIPGFASGVENYTGWAVVGENGPELANFSGGSVYPLSGGASGGNSPSISLGGGGGAQTANIIVNLDSQMLISLMGASLMSSVNVGLGKRSY